MQISWTRLPFAAGDLRAFASGLTDWLGWVFYERLPAEGYEVREEQIYTAFRIARSLTDGHALFAEAGPGTGKSFAYLLPAICWARFMGKPVVVASATGLLQAQLADTNGDIQTLSRLLDLAVDARVAPDPRSVLCQMKADVLYVERPMKGWKRLHNWTRRTESGLRSDAPDVPDILWDRVGWDPSLPCDTCRRRGTCHVVAVRRHYRAAADLVITDHRLFAEDLLTRPDRQADGQMPLLPAYSAVVLDEGHHMPETWQRTQGHRLDRATLMGTLDLILAGYRKRPVPNPDLAQVRLERAAYLVEAARRAGQAFLTGVQDAAEPGEGKRAVARTNELVDGAESLIDALTVLQDELATEEAMHEGTAHELSTRAYQARIDEVVEALRVLGSADSLPWVEGSSLWVVPRRPLPLQSPGRASRTPLLFSSATLAPDYMAQVLQLEGYHQSRVGVPFNLAEQVLVYLPGDEAAMAEGEWDLVRQVIRAMRGRSLVLLKSQAEVERCRRVWAGRLVAGGMPDGLDGPSVRVLWEGDGDRGSMLATFRADVHSVLVGTSFWEGVDVPGESLSCVVIPQLPFPAHDPVIRERRAQAEVRGENPFMAVDLPEMLMKLKQGAGRLIRTARDRGVLALLDRSYVDQPWAGAVDAVLPEGAERTGSLDRVGGFCPPALRVSP